jgi:isopenicillin N synthase-like dioxygenase
MIRLKLQPLHTDLRQDSLPPQTSNEVWEALCCVGGVVLPLFLCRETLRIELIVVQPSFPPFASDMGDVTPPSATAKSIPVVDFSPFRVQEGVLVGDPATPGQLQVASEIDKVCREHGFLCLTGFGMSATQRDEVFAASRTLFALSDEDKGELARISPATNTGYAPFRSESLNRSRPAELKEAFNLRFPPKKVNDLSGCPPGYADVTTYVLGFYKDLAHRYGLACALALGLPVDFFTSTLAHYDLCTARMLHYPPCNWKDTATGDSSGDVSKPVRIGEHTDFGE